MSHATRHVPRPSGLRRGGSVLAAALLAAATGCVLVAPAHAAGSGVPASQPLVKLLRDHVARARPSANAPRVGSVGARRPLTHVRTFLPVIDDAIGSEGKPWVRVRLPGRPTGHKGWIRSDQTRRTSTEWHISVKRSARRVTVYHDGKVERRFKAIVGKPATPTPRGNFFIEEAVALSSKDAGAPFALATSARSNVLQEFNGGPGQIALHGTNNISGALGTAASHGCIRLSTQAITWLARRIGSGIPLTIR